jgi:hypothetical protein
MILATMCMGASHSNPSLQIHPVSASICSRQPHERHTDTHTHTHYRDRERERERERDSQLSPADPQMIVRNKNKLFQPLNLSSLLWHN